MLERGSLLEPTLRSTPATCSWDGDLEPSSLGRQDDDKVLENLRPMLSLWDFWQAGGARGARAEPGRAGEVRD